jgi:high-affinity nickel permease
VTLPLGDWKLDAALGSCLLLGLRHGFDYDHLAAISTSRRCSATGGADCG